MVMMSDKNPDISDAAARDYVRAVVARSGSSFASAMGILPAEKRDAMYAIYAFCREVDDIVDELGSLPEKEHQLGKWRGEIERLYGGQYRVPGARALLGPVDTFGLHKEDFQAIINGMETDAVAAVRMADMETLDLYCDRVASAVGRLSCRVFGIEDELARPIAHALGRALQLTNILRDLDEDAARDRLYLPAALLRAHGITETDPASVLARPAIAHVCDVLADVAENRYEEARLAMAACKRSQVRPALMMMAAYRRILRHLKRRGWRHLSEPVGLTMWEKFWVLLRYGIV